MLVFKTAIQCNSVAPSTTCDRVLTVPNARSNLTLPENPKRAFNGGIVPSQTVARGGGGARLREHYTSRGHFILARLRWNQ